MAIRITPLGGLGEIGMNCMLIEGQSSAFLLDCGLMFSELDHFGIEFVIPNFKHLLAKKDKIKGLICTHGHEDHIGAVPLLFKAGIQVPIFASSFTSLIIRERLKEVGLEKEAKIAEIKPRDTFQIGEFKITPASVNHSIIDALALLIESEEGRIVHTGDFKVDQSPFFGDIMDQDLFKAWGEKGVLFLMSDSTNVEVNHPAIGEDTVAHKLEELVQAARGMVLVSMFSSNVGRVANLFRVAKKTGKKILLTGRSMEQNVALARERGGIEFDERLILPINELDHFDRNKLIVLSTGCQGEPRSALNRIAHEEHPNIALTEGDLVVLSSSRIPGNEKSISRLINDLFRLGAEVVYDSIEEVHSSGHATRPELKKMLEWIQPKFFMPVHGEYRHLVHHAELADECGIPFENILVAQNGDVVEVSQDKLEVIETLEDLRIFVADRAGDEVPKALLKDRRKIAETGVVFVLLSRDKRSGKILHGPEILMRGVVSENFEKYMQDEAKKIMKRVVGEYNKHLKHDHIDPDLDEHLRLEVRRFFEKNTGKKPVVIPLILE